MTCRHCNNVMPINQQKYQHLKCPRCGAQYALSMTELVAPTVTPEHLKQLRITNS